VKKLSEAIHAQFEPRANAYLQSAVHSQGPDLERARQLVANVQEARSRMLDVGCGAGHLAFALAPYFSQTVASDPSQGMLEVARTEASKRGLSGFSTTQCPATSLTFANEHFDVVTTRYSAHHWNELPVALREMHRVLKAGGYLMVIDVLGGANPLSDTHLQAWELLRDPSHVRDYTDPEWNRFLEDAGFMLLRSESWSTRIDFGAWIERMRTPPAAAEAIRRMQQLSPAEVVRDLRLEPDGSFTMQTGLFWCRKRG
jgi:ubiquinone/menaquinone biosynthesis C-methylase UbiE